MEVRVIPFEEKYLAETLAMMRKWSPDHPELGERSLYEWQRCTRYLAMAGDNVVGQICQIPHEFRYADGRPPVMLGWGITLVLDMSDDGTRKAAGRQLLKACEDAPGLKYAAVGVVPNIEGAYLRRGHQLKRDASDYYARFFNPKKALAYWNKPKSLAPALKLANLVIRPRTRTRFGTLDPITRFRPEWDGTSSMGRAMLNSSTTSWRSPTASTTPSSIAIGRAPLTGTLSTVGPGTASRIWISSRSAISLESRLRTRICLRKRCGTPFMMRAGRMALSGSAQSSTRSFSDPPECTWSSHIQWSLQLVSKGKSESIFLTLILITSGRESVCPPSM